MGTLRPMWEMKSCVLCLGAVKESRADEEMRCDVPRRGAARPSADPAGARPRGATAGDGDRAAWAPARAGVV